VHIHRHINSQAVSRSTIPVHGRDGADQPKKYPRGIRHGGVPESQMLSEVNCHRKVKGSDFCRWAIHLQNLMNKLSDVVKGRSVIYGAGSVIQLIAHFDRRSFIQLAPRLAYPELYGHWLTSRSYFCPRPVTVGDHDSFISRICCSEWRSSSYFWNERGPGFRIIALNRSEENSHVRFRSDKSVNFNRWVLYQL